MTESPNIEELLEQARHRIEVEPEEIAEARKRREAVARALRGEFRGSRTYVNGSLAHGDALTPLTDVDLGVVVPDPEHRYGPGKRGPRELQDRAADAIRRELKKDYGDLRVVVEGRKRSIKVFFNDAVHSGGPDFTADAIVAIDNPHAKGLYIPRYNTWDRSHPEQHTKLVVLAIDATNTRFAHVVRLVKHWVRQRSEQPLCSWHVKALALDSITTPGMLSRGLRDWFAGAEQSLKNGPTPDPARVGPDIDTAVPRTHAIRELREALALLDQAIDLEASGWPALAHDKLAQLFNDPQMLPAPPRQVVAQEEAKRLRSRRDLPQQRDRRPTATPVVRSWAR